MKPRKFTNLGILILLALLSLPTVAQMKAHKLKAALSELDLSGEQKIKLKDLRQSMKPEMQRAREELSQAKRSFVESLKTDENDSKVTKNFKQLNSKREALAQKRFEALLKLRQVLNSDQRKKLIDKKLDGLDS